VPQWEAFIAACRACRQSRPRVDRNSERYGIARMAVDHTHPRNNIEHQYAIGMPVQKSPMQQPLGPDLAQTQPCARVMSSPIGDSL
jgi:hypothetical protein